MKIRETKPVTLVPKVGRRQVERAGAAVDETVAVADTASIMGIPEAELTPKVRTAIMTLLDEVQRLRDELKQTQSRIGYLEQLADEDSLIPVINRRAFVRELSRMMSFAERHEVRSSMLYFDLNGMKAINDTYGHAAGDAALVQVANILNEEIRESDVVGRLGGDEFGVIMAQADLATPQEKAASLAAAIESRPLVWRGNAIQLSVAHGAYAFDGRENTDTILDAADRAMYAYKQDTNGRQSA